MKTNKATAYQLLSNGLNYYRSGEWAKALECLEKAKEIYEKHGDVHGIAKTYNNLGLVYADKGEWNKAIEYYEKSLETSESFRHCFSPKSLGFSMTLMISLQAKKSGK